MASTVVVDASVVVKWALNEPGDEAALNLLAEYGARIVDLIAPLLLLAEAASALSKRFRGKELNRRQAVEAFRWIEERRPALIDVSIQEALALSLAHQLSLWDSVYLALAIQHRADLATADRRFFRSMRAHYPFVLLVA